jgi:hypothetical protein
VRKWKISLSIDDSYCKLISDFSVNTAAKNTAAIIFSRRPVLPGQAHSLPALFDADPVDVYSSSYDEAGYSRFFRQKITLNCPASV